ncbi:MAG: hypothetical protein IKS05_07535 [Oscillospiraceae bacterium]|nr:hypothetical protein [Oscillospiraceae bacterium]
MRFFNALEGIRRIRKAMNLSLWASVAAAALVPVSLSWPPPVFPALLLSLAVLGLSLAALILELMGVNQAARDQAHFDSARTLLIFSIVLSLVKAFLSQQSPAYVLLNLISGLLALRITLQIIQGVIQLAVLCGWGDLTDQGRRLTTVVLITALSSVLLSLLNSIFHFAAKYPDLTILIALTALALSILELVLMLRYLARAIEMLSLQRTDNPSSAFSHVIQ